MREPNALAFCGDWHQNHFWGVQVIDECAKIGVDTILHVGDYGFQFPLSFTNAIEDACAENDVMIYFVDGNHDDHPYLWSLSQDEDGLFVVSEHVRCIPRGHRWVWWTKTFLGVGGAASVDKQYRNAGKDWWPTEEITNGDFIKATEGGHADVMVCHDCPSGPQIPGIHPGDYSQWGEEAIRRAERHRDVLYQIWHEVRPALLVHGHYHIPYETSFFGTHVVGLDMDSTSWEANVRIARTVFDLGEPYE